MSRPAAAGLFALAVPLAAALALGAPPARAQEPPPESPDPGAPAPPSAEELLPALFGDPRDPFAGRTTLQARRLRGLTAEVAALVLRGEEGGGIGVAALAAPVPGAAAGEDGRVPAWLWVEIDGTSFLEGNQAETARVEVYAYALTAGGGVADHLAEAFAVEIETLGEAVWEAGLRFTGRLRLPPGEHVLRVLVRNAQSGAAGLAAAPLTVPAPGVPPPLFPTPEERDLWVAVRSWGDGPAAPAPAYPFVAGGRAVTPAALPVLVAGRAAEAHLFGSAAAGPARIALNPAAGGAGGEAPAAVAAAAEAGGPAALRFTTPELPAGEYTLSVAGTGIPPLPVLVVAGDAAERALLWSDLRWGAAGERLAAGGAAAAVLEAPADERGRGGRGAGARGRPGRAGRRLAEAYREALAPLAAGGEDWAAARGALFELQSGALAGDGRGSLAQLQTATLAVAEELAARSPEALPPLLRAHQELYQDFRRRRVFSLASYNRLTVESLAELYAARGGAPELAAAALVSLGGYLQEANLPAGSSRLFRRALALDADGRAARLALAALHERYGDARGAVEQLGPAVAADPADAEAKLRLALNLARGGGDRRRAESLLEEIAAGSGPAWVRALAHQELARRDLAVGDAAAAAARLEAAVAALPDDRGLRLLLALAYDRVRKPREALDELARVTAGGGESPRLRYDGWPRGAIEGARERLDAGAAERRDELGRVLGPRGGGG